MKTARLRRSNQFCFELDWMYAGEPRASSTLPKNAQLCAGTEGRQPMLASA